MANPKPDWLKIRFDGESIAKMNALMDQLKLNTVCQEAHCPNMGECYKKNTATFIIMGNNCTRSCKFCAVTKGQVSPLDPQEPHHVALAAQTLGLKHVVVTSVTRDDLPDGGAAHLAETVRQLKALLPETTVEVLIPDLKGDTAAIDLIIAAGPDVINHNLETVPSLYSLIRPEADYQRSLSVIRQVHEAAPHLLTKSGIMLGLGETDAEVDQLMDDLLATGCDILTVGQYLQPSLLHVPVKEYVTPAYFAEIKRRGEAKGFKFVASAPLVRSSYNALDALEAIRAGLEVPS